MRPRARNSNRYTIILGEQWRQHARPVPGVYFLGTIQRGMHIGALGKLQDGAYVCVNGTSQAPLVARKVEAALAAQSGAGEADSGPPVQVDPL